jgi:hypothetical protein
MFMQWLSYAMAVHTVLAVWRNRARDAAGRGRDDV